MWQYISDTRILVRFSKDQKINCRVYGECWDIEKERLSFYLI